MKSDGNDNKTGRRNFLRNAGLVGLAGIAGSQGLKAVASGTEVRTITVDPQTDPKTITLPFENGTRPMVQYPQKRPLIRLTTRPPKLETPFPMFNDGIITPNDAFFVRYHNMEIPGVIDGFGIDPSVIDPNTFRLTVTGPDPDPLAVVPPVATITTALSLSLSDLINKFERVTVVAVNQCAGNSRAFSDPRMAGGQIANGAMGNARWTGVRLKDILAQAGVLATAKQVTFNGLDLPDSEPPDFVKALDIARAMDGEVMLAYAMNGEDLPVLNGYPLRLVVPGWYGTYWVKHLNEIKVIDKVFDGYYMKTGYRIPNNACGCTAPGVVSTDTVPITKMTVRSFITSLADNASVHVNKTTKVKGIAFDGGSGIKMVEFSEDGGTSWRTAELGTDLGKYSFRGWRIDFKPSVAGKYVLKVRATSVAGETQAMTPIWNQSGYLRNVVETVNVTAG